MRAINAKQLREWLAKVPDDAIVLVPAPDHSYRPATITKGTAMFYPGGHISEDWDQDEAAEIETGKRKAVVIVT